MDILTIMNKRPKRLGFLWAGAALLALLLVLIVLEVNQAFVALDPAVTLVLQSFIPRFLDVPLSIFSLLGALELTSILLLLFLLWLYRVQKLIYFPLGFLFVSILLLELVGKQFVYHPSPPKDFFRYSLPFHFPTGYLRTNYSFPSGHVSRTVFLIIVFVFFAKRLVTNRKLRSFAIRLSIFLGVTMIISRIYLGEHWFSDILGGTLLGAAMGMFSLIYY